MSKHTPGPWHADKCPCGHYACNKYRIRHASADGMFEKDDARLIAAAPELLAELKRLRIAYVYLLEFGRDRITALGGQCDPVDVMERADPALKAAATIIAKAEGHGL